MVSTLAFGCFWLTVQVNVKVLLDTYLADQFCSRPCSVSTFLAMDCALVSYVKFYHQLFPIQIPNTSLKAFSSSFLPSFPPKDYKVDLTVCMVSFIRALFLVYFFRSALIVSRLGPSRLAFFLFTVGTAWFFISSILALEFHFVDCIII